MKSVSHHVKKRNSRLSSQDFVVVAYDIDLRIPILTSAPPRSILVLSGRYHIMSNASIVNNCIVLSPFRMLS